MSKESDPNSQRKRRAREFDDDDTIAILNGVIEFRSNTGGTPTLTQMKPFFDSVKDSLHSQLTQDQLYNKIRHLRHEFHKKANAGVDPTPYDQMFYELSVKAWGDSKGKKKKKKKKPNGGSERIKDDDDDDDDDDDEKDELVEGDGVDSFKYLNHHTKEYWKLVGLPVESLELGLKSMTKSKAKALENKWRQHLEVDLKLQGKWFNLNKDYYAALSAAYRGMTT